ncbi:hypothetical protein, partial [Vibrio parahaemolyticus]|uniref:hypothetical protein n=1 Tax=Vibrio parahaemolyticus TaxID=670 RepID=UPI001C12BC6B
KGCPKAPKIPTPPKKIKTVPLGFSTKTPKKTQKKQGAEILFPCPPRLPKHKKKPRHIGGFSFIAQSY